MSLLPYILDAYTRPSRLLDQHFGLSLDADDLLSPITDPSMLAAYLKAHPTVGYIRPWRTSMSQRDVGSTISIDKDRFQANLDVQQFKPEEITVKATGNNTITIEGKHEEKEDDHGFISRHFVRKYVIPKDCDYNKVESKLSSDGVLTITAPRINVDKSIDHKTIPIMKTGQPAKVEQKKPEKEEKKEIK
ncbi:protein lethal(2)essential for life-like [Coccinella septempunctata]|uniref:protein lethal(2)essential for life-like n=1 Tax=Coccinella septempunctata TaxID=41139 RepID=UPI001D07923C|nr:protein lethal(2)essential for life-like [Coccinella septempunctata]